eukprot:CAMPEP_0205895372 /NCGR_PEP_ID=MMETSP1083-20121108/24356_1 /ASSEMBLY_ACC=CAM_ASM_000430 /TAXON_ID=97485 /ORGANISM="Prymnesium parvum, Strain Texoma1" /LENGTH=42 /DNA_ID= /DNA_START= /DNA_END= /DNA_ORIENTATION=
MPWSASASFAPMEMVCRRSIAPDEASTHRISPVGMEVSSTGV